MCNQNIKSEPSGENVRWEESEKYLLWQADRLAVLFDIRVESPKEKLEYFYGLLERIKEEMVNLEVGWDKCIPILHEVAILYYERVEGRPARRMVRGVSSGLMRSVVHLSQSGSLRKRMMNGFDQQAKEVRALLDVKYADCGETGQE